MTRLGSTILLAAIAAPGGCGDKPRPASNVAPIPPSYPVITRLVSRSQTITISAGPESPLYSAAMADGTIVFNNFTLEELHDRQPEMYHRLAPGIAADASADVSGR